MTKIVYLHNRREEVEDQKKWARMPYRDGQTMSGRCTRCHTFQVIPRSDTFICRECGFAFQILYIPEPQRLYPITPLHVRILNYN